MELAHENLSARPAARRDAVLQKIREGARISDVARDFGVSRQRIHQIVSRFAPSETQERLSLRSFAERCNIPRHRLRRILREVFPNQSWNGRPISQNILEELFRHPLSAHLPIESIFPDRERQFYTVKQAAEETGLTERIILARIAEGVVPAVKIGKYFILPRTSLSPFFKKRQHAELTILERMSLFKDISKGLPHRDIAKKYGLSLFTVRNYSTVYKGVTTKNVG